tara:strand:- start:297 stop:914 length:618 start_codon:yes stop_codon:yes gene_type:complete
MAMSLKVIVPPHPLIKHWLTILRDKRTPNTLYSTGYEQIGKWLTYEALRNWLPYKSERIETFNGFIDGFFINPNYPIRVIAQIPEGLSLWTGSKEIIPNSILSLGGLPKDIKKNEGILLYCGQIKKDNNPIKTLADLKNLGVESKRILLISIICSNEGLNQIAKVFPEQNIYTSCIDNEESQNDGLFPGIGNPLLRLNTMFQEKN